MIRRASANAEGTPAVRESGDAELSRGPGVVARGGRKRKAPRAQDLLHRDDWREGLRFSLKTLNLKSVKRAKVLNEVPLICLQHNLRKGNHEHRHRTPLEPMASIKNSVLIGPDDPNIGAQLAENILIELGLVPSRRDAIIAIELVFQPPPRWDVPLFYQTCLAWVRTRYQHLLSAVVHRDQKRPHMHVLVMAIKNGRLAGAELTSKGNRLMAQRCEFNEYMRGALRLRADRKPRRTMADIFTSPGRGPKTHDQAARRDADLSRKAMQNQNDSARQMPPHHAAAPRSSSTYDLLAHEAPGPANLLALTSLLRLPVDWQELARVHQDRLLVSACPIRLLAYPASSANCAGFMSTLPEAPRPNR